MKQQYISTPRPGWHEPDIKNINRGVTLGGNSGGIVLYMDKEGIYINGYYSGLRDPVKHANLSDFLFISWLEWDRLRTESMRGTPGPKQMKERQPNKVDEPSKEYLESLPIVTLNGVKFHIDVERQERRPVKQPTMVFNFEKQASEKPK
jgi:hypothetical protein